MISANLINNLKDSKRRNKDIDSMIKRYNNIASRKRKKLLGVY